MHSPIEWYISVDKGANSYLMHKVEPEQEESARWWQGRVSAWMVVSRMTLDINTGTK